MISTECGDRAAHRLIALSRQGMLLLIVLAVISGVSCGSDDNGSGGTLGGVLQISVTAPDTAETYTLGSSAADISIGGMVSESPYGKVEDIACNCVGFGCLFDPQCITVYVPRVDVFVQNSLTGQTVKATLDYNYSAQSETSYAWHATVSLASGTNRIVSDASDGKGYAGSDSITIINP